MNVTTLVDLASDSEQLSNLVQYLDKLKQTPKEDSLYQKIQSNLSDTSKHGEILQLILAEADTFFQKGNEKEIVTAFALMSALLMRQSDNVAKELLISLLKIISNDKTDKSSLRLAILGNLYNITQNRELRFLVFTTLLNYAIESNNNDHILSLLDTLNERFKEWNATNSQKREIYKLARRAVQDRDKYAEHKYNVKYLSTFDKETNNITNEVTTEVKEVVINALKLSDLYQYDDLLQLDVVRMLETADNTKELYQLLKIFACEMLTTFLDFVENHKEFLQSIGLSLEECRRKMSLLTLVTLANRYCPEIPYNEVIKELHLTSDEDVELWVIRAVSSKLIEAKMDQSRKVVLVMKTFQRTFTNTQWKQLAEKLNLWRENIRATLKVIQNAKAEKHKQ